MLIQRPEWGRIHLNMIRSDVWWRVFCFLYRQIESYIIGETHERGKIAQAGNYASYLLFFSFLQQFPAFFLCWCVCVCVCVSVCVSVCLYVWCIKWRLFTWAILNLSAAAALTATSSRAPSNRPGNGYISSILIQTFIHISIIIIPIIVIFIVSSVCRFDDAVSMTTVFGKIQSRLMKCDRKKSLKSNEILF